MAENDKNLMGADELDAMGPGKDEPKDEKKDGE